MPPKKTEIKSKIVSTQKSEDKPSIKSESETKMDDKKKSDNDSESDNDDDKQEESLVIKDDEKRKNLAYDAYDFYKNYDPSKNQFDPILTIYERASIIGVRATQLEDGAIPLVDIPEGMENVIEIAELELKMKKIPLIICREGREYWRVADLANYHVD
jgi:DNA-directed RNA polymerase subunit K/omega